MSPPCYTDILMSLVVLNLQSCNVSRCKRANNTYPFYTHFNISCNNYLHIYVINTSSDKPFNSLSQIEVLPP